MISNNTVFILGAGASAPYGYPESNSDLKDDICLNFRADVNNLLINTRGDYRQLEKLMKDANDFIDHFQNSRIRSIDKWLSLNGRYRDIGKLAIVNAIVKKENKLGVIFEGKDKSLDWFSVLFNEMMIDVAIPDHFYFRGVYFITFNYDRVFEHLLYESFRNTFSEVRLEEINRILSNITIIHLYGCIDDPPWTKGGYQYGDSYKLNYLDEARKRIKTVGESVTDTIQTHEMDRLIRSARKIFFLGFGYDPQNLEILGIPQRCKDIQPGPLILGTGKDLLQEEIDKIKLRLEIREEPVIENCDCTVLLRKNLVEAR
jgi:hypothetical protein